MTGSGERPRGTPGPYRLLSLALLLTIDCDALPNQNAPPSPVTLTLHVAPEPVRVGDRVTIGLVVNTPEGYDVRFPDTDAFGEFPVRSGAVRGPRPGAAGLVWSQEFAFEPRLSGDVRIPPLIVVCVPLEGDSAGGPIELRSDEFTIPVQSALAATDDPLHPRGVTAPLLPPAAPWAWWQWALLLSLPVGAGAMLIAIRRPPRRRPPPCVLLSPTEWARAALAELDPETWVARGAEREYHYRLSEIVRGYIERRFGLAAPEMTTEEFLARLTDQPHALSGEGERLRAFLRACDRVKYAAERPGVEHARTAQTSACAFVAATVAPTNAVGGQAA